MKPTQIIQLGGIVPLSSPTTPAEESTVPVVALTGDYHGTTVIRLAPQTLVQAEGLTLKHLGITVSEHFSLVGKSRVQAIGFPAWPIINDPDNAQHALNLVADVEWARKMARSQTKKVWERFEEITIALNNSAPHFVPTLLEELARAFDDAGATKFATRAFSKAREVERSYNLTIDNDRHRHMFLEFARRGVISAKEITAEASSCINRFTDPLAAYTYFLELNIDRIRAGSAPYAGLPRDLLKVGKLAGKTASDIGVELLERIGELPGMRHAPIGFLTAVGKQLKQVLHNRPELLINLFSTPPSQSFYWWYENNELEKWTAAFIELGGVQLLIQNPEHFRQWVLKVLSQLQNKDTYSRSLTDILYAQAELLAGLELDSTFADLPLEILEALCAAGVNWIDLTLPKSQTTQLADYLHRVHNKTNQSHHTLMHVAACDLLAKRIMYGWKLKELLQQNYRTLIRAKGGSLFDVLIQTEIDNLEKAALPAVDTIIHALTIAAKAQASPEVLMQLMDKTTLEPAEILAANMRYGLLTELVWPELERHIHQFQSTFDQHRCLRPRIEFWESYPGVVVSFKEQVAVVAGNKTLFNGTVATPTRVFDMIACTDDTTQKTRLLALHGANVGNISGTWDDGTEVIVTGPDRNSYWGHWSAHSRSSSLQLPAGRLVGNGIILPYRKEVKVIEGNVMGNAQGSCWQICEDLSSYYAAPIVTEVDPETGDGMDRAHPAALTEIASAAGLTLDLESSILLPLPADYDAATCVVSVAGGEYRVVAGTTADGTHVLISADGTSYRSQEPLDGVVTLPGSVLVMNGQELRFPEETGELGTLAVTRDARGEAHWLHRVPRSAWLNLQVRNAEASRRLRAATPEQAAVLLKAVTTENQRDISKLDSLRDRRKLGTSKVRMYPAVFDNCLPDSPAMQAAAEFLGTTDEELCASVVQLALSVRLLESKLRKITLVANRELKREATEEVSQKQRTTRVAEIRLKQQEAKAETPKTIVHKYTAAGQIITAAATQVRQLAQAVTAGQSDRSKNWSWVYSVGMEKALVAWALAPLTSAAARVETSAFLRALAETGVDKQTWQQVWVDWSKAGKGVGKSRAGVRFKLSDDDNSNHAVVLGTVRCDNTKGGRHRVLIQGTDFPTDVRSSVITGPTQLAHELGLSPGFSAAEMQEWATKLESIEVVEPTAWKEEMQPCIDALTENSILTEAAAIMLLAGGKSISTGDLPVLVDTRNMDRWALEKEESDRMAPIYRALKITAAAKAVATQLIEQIPRAVQEFIMLAAFERNTDALKQAVGRLPKLGYELSSTDVEKYLSEFSSGNWHTWSNKAQLLVRITNPLGNKPQLAGGDGYGRALGILLDQATSMPLTDPRREFLANQLEALKTADHPLLTERKTDLPLSGNLNLVPNLKELPWGYHDADAIRALQTGQFDQVIAGLRKNSAAKPTGCVFDPRVVAPETVSAVQAELGLSADAATYFLQVLSLVHPTDTKIKTWNGWKKKHLDAARAELLDRELVVEGKRSRAGRSVFLPGVWWEASAPNIPVESWKSNFYLIRYLHKAEVVVPWCPPTMLYDQLFKQVWQRWAAGDRPSFDEITTKKYRR